MTSVNLDPIQPQVLITSSSLPPKPPAPHWLFIGLIFAFLVTGSSVLAYYLGAKNNSLNNQITQNIPTSIPNVTTIPSPIITPAPGEPDLSHLTWQSPQQVNNLNVTIKEDPQNPAYSISQSKTYLVAKAADGSKLYNLFVSAEGPGNPIIIRLVEKNNQYYYLSPLLDKYVLNDIKNGYIFTPEVKPLESSLVELTIPAEITLTNGQKMRTYVNYGLGKQKESDLVNPKSIDNVFLGKVVTEYDNVQTSNIKAQDVFTRTMYLVLKDSTTVMIKPAYDFFYDDKKISASFTDNSFTSQSFEDAVFVKCGGTVYNTIIRAGDSITGNNQIGTVWNNGKSQPLYENTNPDSNILKIIYDQYKVGRDYPSGPPFMSYDEFLKQKTNLIWHDPFGDWVVYTNNIFAPLAECGKPVIYLYPSTDTQVNVQVGAAITKSDPFYPQGGWTVMAHPDGQLSYQNQSYPNLFWEGQGQGIYPNYRQYGTVVSQQNLISTLQSQLSKLGLNSQESSDFMAFWQSKLPTTPFVRLTWLGTKDMDNLAPLNVSPAPDTRIRIFLEFEGLQKPVNLKPQVLSSPVRRGFTLVEWGGLLINP